jgi:alginate O-acetyltransferase complex protein AlgI
MLFQSWSFLVFLAISYPCYLALKQTRWRWPSLAGLALISYVFYGFLNLLYPILLLYTTVVDYLIVRCMVGSSRKRMWITLSIVNNLALLVFFKYGAFIVDNLNTMLTALRIPYELVAPGILLPIGISFYTFRNLSYTIDCYRGTIARESNFFCHAAFVSFFPLLLAGPIERAKTLLPQLRANRSISRSDLSEGLSLFVVGLFKKLALADYLSIYVDKVYGMPGEYQSVALILATCAFSWQIYFDFSGYTDMARGIARLFGFQVMLNFNNPYLATGFSDFWKRWHISLSSWFRDYVYIPLGGNRCGATRVSFNIFITMLISGLWHGSTWMFVIWGAVHGVYASLFRRLETSHFYRERIPVWIKRLFIFSLVSFAWIFFRASSLSDAGLIIQRIFTTGYVDPSFPLLAMALLLLVVLYQCLYESKYKSVLERPALRVTLFLAMIMYLWVFTGAGSQSFIYFQF